MMSDFADVTDGDKFINTGGQKVEPEFLKAEPEFNNTMKHKDLLSPKKIYVAHHNDESIVNSISSHR